jgi:short-subunit dehydrogenase
MRKNIIITGASSGLGAQLARVYASEGRNLALCARRLDDLERVKAECLALNPNIQVSIKVLDVTDFDMVFTTFKAFHAEFGTIDRVIVNAGRGKGAPLGTGQFEMNRAIIETNMTGALAQCEAALEIFRAQNYGHLVTIASMASVRGVEKMPVYAASKAGLANLSEGLRLGFEGTPIVITCILPGYILTPINDKFKQVPMRAGLEEGTLALHKAIESEAALKIIPDWRWSIMRFVLRHAPLWLVKKLG